MTSRSLEEEGDGRDTFCTEDAAGCTTPQTQQPGHGPAYPPSLSVSQCSVGGASVQGHHGAHAAGLERAKEKRRHEARRAANITRTVWVLAHALIFAAILSTQTALRDALDECDWLLLLIAAVLVITNTTLYIWVSLSNPGYITPSAHASGPSVPTPDPLARPAADARNKGRHPTTPAAPHAAPHVRSISARSAPSGRVSLPTTPGGSIRNGGISEAATLPTRSYVRSPLGFTRVSAADDHDAEAFHDGGGDLVPMANSRYLNPAYQLSGAGGVDASSEDAPRACATSGSLSQSLWQTPSPLRPRTCDSDTALDASAYSSPRRGPIDPPSLLPTSTSRFHAFGAMSHPDITRSRGVADVRRSAPARSGGHNHPGVGLRSVSPEGRPRRVAPPPPHARLQVNAESTTSSSPPHTPPYSPGMPVRAGLLLPSALGRGGPVSESLSVGRPGTPGRLGLESSPSRSTRSVYSSCEIVLPTRSVERVALAAQPKQQAAEMLGSQTALTDAAYQECESNQPVLALYGLRRSRSSGHALGSANGLQPLAEGATSHSISGESDPPRRTACCAKRSAAERRASLYLCDVHCIKLGAKSDIRRSASSVVCAMQRVVHHLGRWLTVFADFNFRSDHLDDELCLYETSGASDESRAGRNGEAAAPACGGLCGRSCFGVSGVIAEEDAEAALEGAGSPRAEGDAEQEGEGVGEGRRGDAHGSVLSDAASFTMSMEDNEAAFDMPRFADFVEEQEHYASTWHPRDEEGSMPRHNPFMDVGPVASRSVELAEVTGWADAASTRHPAHSAAADMPSSAHPVRPRVPHPIRKAAVRVFGSVARTSRHSDLASSAGASPPRSPRARAASSEDAHSRESSVRAGVRPGEADAAAARTSDPARRPGSTFQETLPWFRPPRPAGPVLTPSHSTPTPGLPPLGSAPARPVLARESPVTRGPRHPRPLTVARTSSRRSLPTSARTASARAPPPPNWFSRSNPGRTCPYCSLWQPLRAKHCHDCSRCVRRFDHHCAWIGNCVGEGNHRLFFAYLSSQLALLGWALRQCCSAFQGRETLDIWILHQLHLLVAMLVLGLFLLFVGGLWLYHAYLALTNQTTYEVSFRDRVPYLKDFPEHVWPFSNGLGANLESFCCVPKGGRTYVLKTISQLEAEEAALSEGRAHVCCCC